MCCRFFQAAAEWIWDFNSYPVPTHYLAEEEKLNDELPFVFEKVVYDSLIEAGFEKYSITHSLQKFPDFVLEDKESGNRLGVEVKKTDGARWEVIGGSIYESLKNDIDDKYVLMAKLGGDRPEVRLRKYEECIAEKMMPKICCSCKVMN